MTSPGPPTPTGCRRPSTSGTTARRTALTGPPRRRGPGYRQDSPPVWRRSAYQDERPNPRDRSSHHDRHPPAPLLPYPYPGDQHDPRVAMAHNPYAPPSPPWSPPADPHRYQPYFRTPPEGPLGQEATAPCISSLPLVTTSRPAHLTLCSAPITIGGPQTDSPNGVIPGATVRPRFGGSSSSKATSPYS